MRKAENLNAPDLWGFVIGAAAGLVAFAVLLVIGKSDLFPAAALGGGVAVVAGLILGMPWGGSAPAPKLAARPAPAPTAQPVAEPVAAAVVAAPAAGPLRLTGPRNGKADNLKEIEGIGPALEKLVNELGFYHFDQIATWSDADVATVDAEMKTFKGRITRDRWVAQAKLIVSEGLEAFRERARTNNY